jgi:hypothetical protein
MSEVDWGGLFHSLDVDWNLKKENLIYYVAISFAGPVCAPVIYIQYTFFLLHSNLSVM